MNAIQSKTRCELYLDMTRAARFTFQEFNIAFNDAVAKYIDDIIGDPKQRDPESVQWVQQVRDSLYTLIATATPSITNGAVVTNEYYSATPSAITFPVDYRDFLLLMTTIDGYSKYSKPTDFNALGPLFLGSFRHPTNLKTYFNEFANGITIWRGVGGTFSAATLTYIKQPTAYNCGIETQLINAGGTLTNALTYYATDISVYNGVSYQVGDTITGNGAVLTSGQVILSTNTSPIALPAKVHEVINKMAAETLLGTTQAYNPAAFAEKAAGQK